MSPDGPKSPPPEEKLLKLIRGAPTPLPQAVPLGAPGRAPQAAPRRNRMWSWIPSWGLRGMNLVLGCLIVGELAVLGIIVMTPPPTQTLSIPPSSPSAKGSEPPRPPDVATTLASSISRPLFRTQDAQSAPSPSAAASQSAEAKSFASRLNLLGMVAGDPAQAIIEDTQTKKTYFVSVGQRLIEDVIVREIGRDRVVLDLHGEVIELSL